MMYISFAESSIHMTLCFSSHLQGLIDNFLTCVVPLSTHPFGCRVIQRVLEHCNDAGRKSVIMAEILRETRHLTKDQYGNYVIQHVLQHGQEAEREQVCGKHFLQ